MSDSSSERTAPSLRPVDFDRPPVIETLMGLQFAPIKGWDIPYYGLFWDLIRREYPRFQIQPPIGSEIQVRFGAGPDDPSKPVAEIQSALPVRCWFFDASETRLIQVQNNCFIHNWRKTAETDSYKHYDAIRPIFMREWSRFVEFLDRNGLARPDVWQCEITYVNHIERDQGWSAFADLHQVTPLWSGRTSTNFLPPPGVVMLNVIYPMADGPGQLQVTAQPAVRTKDAKDVIQLTLSARGKPRSSTISDLLAWMDIGHEWVVRGFKDVTTVRMHELWGVK